MRLLPFIFLSFLPAPLDRESTSLGSKPCQLAMAWRSSGATNAALISNLAEHGLIKSERVRKAMLAVCASCSLSVLDTFALP
jgi:hypothetical protein